MKFEDDDYAFSGNKVKPFGKKLLPLIVEFINEVETIDIGDVMAGLCTSVAIVLQSIDIDEDELDEIEMGFNSAMASTIKKIRNRYL